MPRINGAYGWAFMYFGRVAGDWGWSPVAIVVLYLIAAVLFSSVLWERIRKDFFTGAAQ